MSTTMNKICKQLSTDEGQRVTKILEKYFSLKYVMTILDDFTKKVCKNPKDTDKISIIITDNQERFYNMICIGENGELELNGRVIPFTLCIPDVINNRAPMKIHNRPGTIMISKLPNNRKKMEEKPSILAENFTYSVITSSTRFPESTIYELIFHTICIDANDLKDGEREIKINI